MNGSVEVAPLLNLSHWIVDLVDTGNTLRANGLVERETILQCGAVLVANRARQKLKLDAYLESDGAAGEDGDGGEDGADRRYAIGMPVRTAVSDRSVLHLAGSADLRRRSPFRPRRLSVSARQLDRQLDRRPHARRIRPARARDVERRAVIG